MGYVHRITQRMVILMLVAAIAAIVAVATAAAVSGHDGPAFLFKNASAKAHAAAVRHFVVNCPSHSSGSTMRCHANIPSGPRGFTGPQGATGRTGATGPQGSQGPQGPAGPTSLTNFRATLTPSGTDFASANTVTLYTDGATHLTGHCWTDSSGTTNAALGIGSSTPAYVTAYSNTSNPQTTQINSSSGDQNVMEDDATGTATAGSLAGPWDGTWAVMTTDLSAYFTGLGSAAVYPDGSTPCVFTGHAVAS